MVSNQALYCLDFIIIVVNTRNLQLAGTMGSAELGSRALAHLPGSATAHLLGSALAHLPSSATAYLPGAPAYLEVPINCHDVKHLDM